MNQGYFRHDWTAGWLLLLFSRIPPLRLTLRSEFNVSPLCPKVPLTSVGQLRRAVMFMDPGYWVPGSVTSVRRPNSVDTATVGALGTKHPLAKHTQSVKEGNFTPPHLLREDKTA